MMAASSLALRVATALVLVPLVLAALFLLPPRGFALVLLAIVLLAALEWARLCRLAPASTLAFAVAIGGAGLALLQGGRPGFADGVVYAVCGVASVFWLVVAPGWLARGWPAARGAGALVGFLVLVATFVAVAQLQARSPWLVLAAFALVWVADTAAYFAGRAWGRRKLAPAISPGKTWEGVWGALGAVAVYALALVALLPFAGIGVPSRAAGIAAFVACALVLAAVSVVGDLFESLLKRQAGVKDSGTLLPGHGGVLDRVDALLSAMPLAAIAATAWLPRGEP